jgi:hypothetical protein
VQNAATGLVAAYSFDAGSGTTVADASGRGNAGIVSGATWTTAGRNNGGLSFDGVNDLVTVADAASLDLAGAMTLSAWVRPSALGSSWRTVLVKEQPGNLVYALYANAENGRPSGHVFAGSDQFAVGSAPLALNAWSHLAATWDGSLLRLYVNGTQVGSRSLTGTMPASSGALRIGGNTVWPEWFAGVLDDVRVYDRALSAAEIQADLASPVG